MTIHLDTSFLIRMGLTATSPAQWLAKWLAEGREVAVSSIAWSEYLCGPLNKEQRANSRQVVGDPLPFAEPDAELAAELFNLAGLRRRSLPDCQIAAVAIRFGAALATVNPADFARFTPAGLVLAVRP